MLAGKAYTVCTLNVGWEMALPLLRFGIEYFTDAMTQKELEILLSR